MSAQNERRITVPKSLDRIACPLCGTVGGWKPVERTPEDIAHHLRPFGLDQWYCPTCKDITLDVQWNGVIVTKVFPDQDTTPPEEVRHAEPGVHIDLTSRDTPR